MLSATILRQLIRKCTTYSAGAGPKQTAMDGAVAMRGRRRMPPRMLEATGSGAYRSSDAAEHAVGEEMANEWLKLSRCIPVDVVQVRHTAHQHAEMSAQRGPRGAVVQSADSDSLNSAVSCHFPPLGPGVVHLA